MNRPQVTVGLLDKIMGEFGKNLQAALKKNGDGVLVSLHEIRGCLDEELDEFYETQHKNDTRAARKELWDVVIAAMWGIASIDAWAQENFNAREFVYRFFLLAPDVRHSLLADVGIVPPQYTCKERDEDWIRDALIRIKANGQLENLVAAVERLMCRKCRRRPADTDGLCNGCK